MKNEADAQDVMQDALVLIFKNIHQFQSDAIAFKPWIRKIVINVALAKFRKASYKNESYPGELICNDYQAASVLSQLNAEDIMNLLHQLPPVHQQVFNLYVIDGYKHAEIAKMTGLKESSSRTMLTRARQRLQDMIIQQNKIRS